jgi:NAD(P)-dependent dehydrogenase (short-subunit alcohol dehydrogenase family)
LRRNKGRVINVSAGLAKLGDIDYDFKSKQEYSNGLLLYAQSKLAQILFTQELNDRYGEDITTYSLHPGVVRTEIGREFPILRYLMMPIGYLLHKTPKEGAQTTVFAALVDKNIIPSGSYLENCEKHDVSPFKYTSPEDKSVREKLWSSSVEAVKLTE